MAAPSSSARTGELIDRRAGPTQGRWAGRGHHQRDEHQPQGGRVRDVRGDGQTRLPRRDRRSSTRRRHEPIPSARSSMRMRRHISHPNPAATRTPVTGAESGERHARVLAEHREVVGVAQVPVGPGRDERRAGQHEHAEGPAAAEAGDRPELERLGRREHREAPEQALTIEHGIERAGDADGHEPQGIREPHPAEHVVVRLHRPLCARALARCARRAAPRAPSWRARRARARRR